MAARLLLKQIRPCEGLGSGPYCWEGGGAACCQLPGKPWVGAGSSGTLGLEVHSLVPLACRCLALPVALALLHWPCASNPHLVP